MAAGPGIRIGDAEREATAASLREHYAKGRLTHEEFQQRLDAVFAAKTDTELNGLTNDLPHADRYAPPWPPSQPSGAGQLGGRQPGGRRRTGARSYAWLSMSLVLIAAIFLLVLSWPFGALPKAVLLALAIIAFVRRILRFVLGGRRGRR